MMKQDYGHIIIDAQTKEKCNGDYIPAGDSGEEVIEAWLSNSLQYCQRHEMDGRTGKMNAYCKAGSKIRGGNYKRRRQLPRAVAGDHLSPHQGI